MSNWQPISTAPKDGTHILIWYKFFNCQIVSWDGLTWVTKDGFDEFGYAPTHWQPLPEPPKEDA